MRGVFALNEKYEYRVIRSNRKSVAMQIKNGELIVRAPYLMSSIAIENFVYRNREWIDKQYSIIEEKLDKLRSIEKLSDEEIAKLRKSAANTIPERVKYYAELLGVSYNRISLRCQRTRWGSCSGRGNLNFNYLLMLAPVEVLDSVVVHELCHLKHMDHSDAFYGEILKIYPDYFKHDRWLDEHGAELLARVDREDC